MFRIFLYLYVQQVRIKTLLAYRGKSWRNLPIRECGEKLVMVSTEMCYPFYHQEMKISDGNRILLREGVMEKYLLAREILQRRDLDLLVYDGWRSIQLQENLFWYYLKLFMVSRFNLQESFIEAESPRQIKQAFFALSLNMQEVLREANQTYVSWPSADPKSPSPHTTGGAIDVWPYENGRRLNLGVPFDWMEEDAGAFYHLKRKRKKFPGNDGLAVHYRNLLIYAMTQAGFSCYGPEIWHFNYGNQMDSLVSGKLARYSYVEP